MIDQLKRTCYLGDDKGFELYLSKEKNDVKSRLIPLLRNARKKLDDFDKSIAAEK
jgi:hypothetical protein